MRRLLDVLADFRFLPSVHAVSGCVRDVPLGVDAADVDLATSAPPEEVIRSAPGRGHRPVPAGIWSAS